MIMSIETHIYCVFSFVSRMSRSGFICLDYTKNFNMNLSIYVLGFNFCCPDDCNIPKRPLKYTLLRELQSLHGKYKN